MNDNENETACAQVVQTLTATKDIRASNHIIYHFSYTEKGCESRKRAPTDINSQSDRG